jgi:hypothetical protein
MAYYELLSSSTLSWVPLIVAFAAVVTWYIQNQNSKKPYIGIPVLSTNRNDYLSNGRSLLEEGSKKFPSCFQVQTGTYWKIVVPNRFAQELKNNRDLSFNEAHTRDSFTSYPGLEPFREIFKNDTFIQEVVRKKLTQSLGLITDGMSHLFSLDQYCLIADLPLFGTGLVEETKLTYQALFGDSKEWLIRVFKTDVQDIIARAHPLGLICFHIH